MVTVICSAANFAPAIPSKDRMRGTTGPDSCESLGAAGKMTAAVDEDDDKAIVEK